MSADSLCEVEKMHDLYVFIQSLYNRIPILLFVTDFTFAVLLLSLKWFPRVHDSLKLKVKVKLYSVCQNNPPLRFSGIFPKRLGIFRPNFTRLLYVSIYARLQIFIQLPTTLTELCHIKRDHTHPVNIMCAECPSLAETHVDIF